MTGLPISDEELGQVIEQITTQPDRVAFEFDFVRRLAEQLLAARQAAASAVVTSPTVADQPVAGRPARIQRQRTAGWRMPAGAVYVGRSSRWSNPYAIGDQVAVLADPSIGVTITGTLVTVGRGLAVELFRAYLAANPALVQQARDALAGRDLACWCAPGTACHGDVWLEVLNPAGAAPSSVLGRWPRPERPGRCGDGRGFGDRVD